MTYFDSTGNESCCRRRGCRGSQRCIRIWSRRAGFRATRDREHFLFHRIAFRKAPTCTFSGPNSATRAYSRKSRRATFAGGTATAAVRALLGWQDHCHDSQGRWRCRRRAGRTAVGLADRTDDQPRQRCRGYRLGYTPIIIEASEALDPNSLNFEFSDGTSSVDGWSRFGDDDMAFYFFPSNILSLDKDVHRHVDVRWYRV